MSRTAKLLTLGLLGGGGTTITYLFRDEFTTPLVAGAVNGTAAEPGPGTRIVTDPGSGVSISGGELVMVGNTGWNTVVYYGGISRAAGRVFIASRKVNVAVSAETGLSSSSPPTGNRVSPHLITLKDDVRVDGTIVNPSAQVDGAYYLVAFVLRATGAFAFVKGGTDYVNWTLVWVNVSSNDATVYPAAAVFHAAAVSYPHMFVRDLPAPFNTDFGIALLNVSSPADATEYTGDADAVIDMTVTAPGSLDGSAATRCGFYYRADADLTPSWHAYVDGLGAFNLDSIASDGTRTNRITVASVITGGATRTIRVICQGTKHNAFTLNGTTWTKRGAEITLSLNDTVTTIEPSIPAGWTGANLRCYPRTSAAYAELDRGN